MNNFIGSDEDETATLRPTRRQKRLTHGEGTLFR